MKKKFITLLIAFMFVCCTAFNFPACGHTHHYVGETVAPTCTESGYTIYTCSCGDIKKGVYVAPKGHDYIESIVAPTCTEKGYTKYTCSCNDTKQDSYVEPTGHVFESSSMIYLENGVKLSLCKGKDAYQVYGYSYSGTASKIVLPSIHNKVPIISIRDSAFSHCDTLTDIVIPENITYIGNEAFYNCVNLKTVLIPDSVAYIGDGVFDECSNLQYTEYKDVKYLGGEENLYLYLWKADSTSISTVKIHDDCQVIGSQAFEDCGNLWEVVIPNSVKMLGESAFYGCDQLVSLKIGNGVTHIGSNTFSFCSKLIKVEFPNSLKHIGHSVLANCTDLKEVILPEGLEVIEPNMFYKCQKLTKVAIPDGVSYIYKSAFEGCSSLNYTNFKNGKYLGNTNNPYLYLACVESNTSSTVNVHEKCKIIENSIFQDCRNLTNIIVEKNNETYQSIDGNLYSKDGKTLIRYASAKPATSFLIFDEVATISDRAFEGCNNLTKVEMTDNVTVIGASAFLNCDSLTRIIISNEMREIGSFAFDGCISLTKIIIPNSVSKMGFNVFYRCESLTVYCRAKNKPIGWNSDWDIETVTVVWGYTGE